MKKPRGILYCICNRANEGVCDECEKYKRISPDHTGYYPLWKRILRETKDVPEQLPLS